MIFGFFSKKQVPFDGHCLVGVWVKSGSKGVVTQVGGQLQGVWCLRDPEEGET